jgi:hypothetical protein
VSVPPRRRVLLGRLNTLAERMRVYRTDDGFEIDRLDYADVRRQRVPYAEVGLVTLHARTGGPLAWVASVATLLFAGLAALLQSEPPLLYAFAGVAFLLGLIAGTSFVLPTWTITVYGRRTVARLAFRLREAKARRTFAEIGRRVGEAQERRRP